MGWQQEWAAAKKNWSALSSYQKFEHLIVLVLTAIIMVVVVAALWNLAVKVIVSIVLTGSFDPTDYTVFQTVFGMIFTVIIGLEFKRSILMMAERKEGIVQVRTVVLIALLAVVRKVIILDLNTTDPMQIFSLAAAVVALGSVYWLVVDQDRKWRAAAETSVKKR
jgi:uncharacterized membrane protein (DUF373 family)